MQDFQELWNGYSKDLYSVDLFTYALANVSDCVYMSNDCWLFSSSWKPLLSLYFNFNSICASKTLGK